MSRDHDLDRVRTFLRNVEWWMRCDVAQQGVGPSGGFLARLTQAQEAVRIFRDLYPCPSVAVDGGTVDTPEAAAPGRPTPTDDEDAVTGPEGGVMNPYARQSSPCPVTRTGSPRQQPRGSAR